MKNRVTAESAADLFAFELCDDALERAAAVADGLRITIGACTHWYHCSWPMSPGEKAAVGRGQKPAV